MTIRTSLKTLGLIIATTLLLSACGGGGGSSSNTPQQVHLDYYNSTVARQTVSNYFSTLKYGPTQDFFHFTEQRAVIHVHAPNNTLDFSLAVSIHLFEPSETPQRINRWINNQHSDGLYPDAPEPVLSVNLAAGSEQRIDDQNYVGREVGTLGDTYDLYDLMYTIDAYEHPQVRIVSAFEAITPVAQHINQFGNILNTPLPLHETFGALSTDAFFSSDYQRLSTSVPRFAPSLADPNPAFYYPLCCSTQDGIDETRLRVQDNTLMISDAQFTLGQTLHRFPDSQAPNPKIDTVYPQDLRHLWGELDLSEPYRISFCVVDADLTGVASASFGLWLNLNVTEGVASYEQPRLFTIPVDALTPGARLTINVPGAVTNSTGNNPAAIAQIANHKGSERSFLQLRVGNGGYLVMRDLVIEHQTQDNTSGLTCNASSN